MRNKKWTGGREFKIPARCNGDEKIWRLYSLCLVCNRHVAEFWTDDEVSIALNNMAERLPLPHGFDFETWSPLS